MNERIRELWQQAADSTAAYPSGQNNSWETQVNFLEKFAELIVQECIDCLDKQHVDIPEDADLNDNKTWTSATMNSTVNMCVGKVKQHFGVEE